MQCFSLMAPKLTLPLSILLLILPHCQGKATATTTCHGGHGGKVAGMFVFGSSLVDNGNNNFLSNAGVRADYLPYGVDFPLGPSGRFSNGRNVVDALGELLELPGLVPPFADPATRGPRAVHGVNFASGGSGILDQTGLVTGEVTSLKQQITNFEEVTLPDLRAQLQEGVATTNSKKRQHLFDQCYLSRCLFVIGTGGNDYLLNYFSPRNNNNRPPLSEFTQSLITNISNHLQRLYALGARKFVIFSLQPMGCSPVVRSFLNITGEGCAAPMNNAALLFNSKLKSLVDTARWTMIGANIAYINSYKIVKDTLDHPVKHDIGDTTRACCEMPRGYPASKTVLCEKEGRICRDRTKYVFFDGLHPTDVVNARIARKGYGSKSAQEVYPINVKKLVML